MLFGLVSRHHIRHSGLLDFCSEYRSQHIYVAVNWVVLISTYAKLLSVARPAALGLLASTHSALPVPVVCASEYPDGTVLQQFLQAAVVYSVTI
ncbi:hypothetical protein D9619_009229 [Psilocybe cf. subviscida]|uniref:Uncharacterized protein n=1 Tax=Psilocybe cf. subviscida TaxID=2480587 RepID=A0A8H5FAC7_9AGAR|nr:hypothetical protein D9619_009229 [Psilocybe cf. subviscida]